MVNLIKNKTDCVIYIGKNGVIWVRGDNKTKAVEAILTIERESHTVGLTEKIEKMLEGEEWKTEVDEKRSEERKTKKAGKKKATTKRKKA